MRYFIIFLFICITGKLQAEETFKGKPAGLLTFSKKIPLQLDPQNSKVLEEDLKAQAKHNENIRLKTTLPWQKIFLFLIALSFLLALRVFSKKGGKIAKDPVKTAHDVAQAQLDLIKGVKNDEEYYEKLSNILRFYIEDAYNIKTKSKTTEEFLRTFKDENLSPKFPENKLAEFLTFSDLVKFAKKAPDDQDCATAYNLVSNFIKS